MKNDAETIVESFNAAWFLRDLPAALANLSDDIRFAQHFSDPALPFAGETVGKGAMRERLAMILANWHFLEYRPTHIVTEGSTVRTICPFVVRHRPTGDSFDGTFRHIWTVQDSKINAIDEYLDLARLKAFLRLLQLPA